MFLDPVHGSISLDERLVKIINTPQFQRLRYLKQLGACYYVYPGASHNRFEHSIGTCHLAGELVRFLKRNQLELGITDRDVFLVEVAGLCHDLGHGPFSHLFDVYFIPKVNKKSNIPNKWKHEEASCAMFEYLLEKNPQVWKDFTEEDITFVKEMINPPEGNKKGSEKTFLYEIISNSSTGIDVDKFDYLARDSHHLGIKTGFNHTRYIQCLRVLQVEDGSQHICPRDKEVTDLYDLFHVRYMLHKRAYQHKINKLVEIMITDAFVLADEHLRFPRDPDVADSTRLKLSETVEHMDAYVRVTDHVYHQILHSEDENLKEARKIIERIEKRNLYRWIGKLKGADETPDKEQMEKHCVDFFKCKMNYGKGSDDPLQGMLCWKKQQPDHAVKIPEDEVPENIPKNFQDEILHFYCTSDDPLKCELAQKWFDDWKGAKLGKKE